MQIVGAKHTNISKTLFCKYSNLLLDKYVDFELRSNKVEPTKKINEEWYNDDCSVYNENKIMLKTDDSIRLVDKIKELEREHKIANEV